MPATPIDYENLVRTIRNTSSSADQKKTAAATIALCLIESQAIGGTVVGGALSDAFNSGGDFENTVAKIQAALGRI